MALVWGLSRAFWAGSCVHDATAAHDPALLFEDPALLGEQLLPEPVLLPQAVEKLVQLNAFPHRRVDESPIAKTMNHEKACRMVGTSQCCPTPTVAYPCLKRPGRTCVDAGRPHRLDR